VPDSVACFVFIFELKNFLMSPSQRAWKPTVTILMAALTLSLPSSSRALTVPPDMDKALRQAMTDLYNINVPRSEQEFQETIGRFPGEPLPHLFYAGCLWWLAAEEFQNPTLRESLKNKFDREIAQTIHAAEAKSERLGSENDEICFCLGGAYGLSGRWKVLDGHWLKAYNDGKMGQAYLKKAIALNPQLYDADLGLGIYDYYTDTLSGFFKRIAASLFLRGNKERGLEELRTASLQGHFSAVEAKLFLINVYEKDERDYQKALDIAVELRKNYPESPLFHYMEIFLLFDVGNDDACAQEALSFINKIKAHNETYETKQTPLPSLFLANVQIKKGDLEGAVKTLSEGINAAPDAPAAWLTYCYLRRAQGEDILGRRTEALQDYHQVLGLPPFRGSHKKARPYLKTPCTLEQAVASMKDR
jgi:tetratricopeptide (TPR) repeat protein